MPTRRNRRRGHDSARGSAATSPHHSRRPDAGSSSRPDRPERPAPPLHLDTVTDDKLPPLFTPERGPARSTPRGDMDDLIFSINNIQDQFKRLSQKTVDLPQIVVVGSQSAGKSSVLESLVRRSFLPRGSGIVTRCPIILRLVNCPLGDVRRAEKDIPLEEWGEFDGEEENNFKIDDIQKEIERRTAEIAGENRGISTVPIVIKIFSPNVVTLTLVDLPGITKVAVGDQPKNIEEQIIDLINQYIKNPNSIILAVIAANNDMATSECIKMAHEVDPEGERTLAVVTKLDLMDKGTDATEILTGMVIPVKLGIIGVVNRSQMDINQGKSIEDTLQDEEIFIKNNYPELADRNGSRYLSQMLQSLLIQHIKKCLPDMRKTFSDRLEECRSILEKCGTKVIDERACLHNTISVFCTAYSKMMKGEFVDMKSITLTGGAKLCCLFKDLEHDLTSKNPIDEYSVEQVMLTIRQTSGPEPPMIFSELAFEELMRPLIKNMREPSRQCIENVAQELKDVSQKSASKDLSIRFPRATTGIRTCVDELIDKLKEKTKDFVQEAINIEEGHITHSHFLNFKNDSLQKILDIDSENDIDLPFRKDSLFLSKAKVKDPNMHHILRPTIQDSKHAMILGEMLTIYYGVVANRVKDTVAKATMTYLVNGLQRDVQLELAAKLGAADMMKKLFKEDSNVTLLRMQKEKELVALQTSLKELHTLDIGMSDQVDF